MSENENPYSGKTANAGAKSEIEPETERMITDSESVNEVAGDSDVDSESGGSQVDGEVGEEKETIFAGERDPLGYLIIPFFGLVLVAVILLWFQQKPNENKQRTYPVTGMVTFEGKPLDGFFQVSFFPIDENSDHLIASGLVEDGKYTLVSGIEGLKGAMPGKYKVCIRMLEGPEESWRVHADATNIKINPKDGGTIVPDDPDPPYPKEYVDSKTTPHRAIVVEGDNEINIEL